MAENDETILRGNQYYLPGYGNAHYQRLSEIKARLSDCPTIGQRRQQKGYSKNEPVFCEQVDFFGNIHFQQVEVDTYSDISARLLDGWSDDKSRSKSLSDPVEKDSAL